MIVKKKIMKTKVKNSIVKELPGDQHNLIENLRKYSNLWPNETRWKNRW